MMQTIIRILCVLGLTMFCASCGGSGGGGSTAPVSTTPPPPPPPLAFACTGPDTFPGFLYVGLGIATSQAGIHLASSDGCQSELVSTEDIGGPMHMTADGSKGVIVWTESSDIDDQHIIRRLDFTVDGSGNLQVGQPGTILPLAGEEALAGDHLWYQVGDVWGDATHDSLYVTVTRTEHFNSGPNAGASTQRVLIYDLNTLTNMNDSPDVRTIFDQFIPGDGTPNSFGWLDAGDPSTLPDCFTVPYPQFVPTCYRAELIKFNPSGTRLYLVDGLAGDLQDSGVYWGSTMRINIDKTADPTDPTPGNWLLAGPELVYAADAAFGEMTGPFPRPEADPLQLPSPEYVAVGLGDGSAGPTSEVIMILNADQCAAVYVPFANGTLEAQSNLWQQCKDESTLSHTTTMPQGGYSWQSPNALLRGTYVNRETGNLFDIHRIYLSGALAGTEQLVVENAGGPDTGN